MTELIPVIDTPAQIAALSRDLRAAVAEKPVCAAETIEVFERWSAALRGGGVDEIPGVAFLRLWLRRGTLEPIVQRELGMEALRGGWRHEGRGRLRFFPVGVVGHWPAGNIEIQPALSMSCALLGGNACLVRVPTGLVETTRQVVARLRESDTEGVLARRLACVSFPHERRDLQEAMAQSVDGAMIWGGAEAVTTVRALPFPHWARVMVFGPRLSVAAMDAATWSNPAGRGEWCQRLARDVWQFDQQACSSPQALFLERGDAQQLTEFVGELKSAFAEENRVHPRTRMQPALASAIALARASWLLGDVTRQAVFPEEPDWTILVGEGSDIPKPTQGRTLHVLVVNDLREAVGKFAGVVQTLGLAMSDAAREEALAEAAGREGVDRMVKLGRMHVFGSPWDGTNLVGPMVRTTRCVSSLE